MLGKHNSLWVGALLALAALTAGAQMPLVILDKQAQLPFMKEGGAKVVDVVKAPGGMLAYTVLKDGKPIVFYVTPDKSVAFVGVMFDAATGRNLSDAFVERSQALVHKGKEAAEVATTSGPSVPASDAGKLLSAAVVGIVEGKASAQTVFVFFDPRCPYCHNLHRNTREAVKRGASVKWIPVNTLGDQGLALSVATLRRGVEGLEALSNGSLKGATDVPLKDRAEIGANTELLKALTASVGLQAATPTIIYPGGPGKMFVAQNDGSNKALLAAAFGGGGR